jgi:hypothetical protein
MIAAAAGELGRRRPGGEVRFWLGPVAGDGGRLRLISTATFSSGAVRLSYEPSEAGP